MHIAYTSDQVALRRELRDYFAELMTPEVLEEVGQDVLEVLDRDGLPLGQHVALDRALGGGQLDGGPHAVVDLGGDAHRVTVQVGAAAHRPAGFP